MSFCVGLCVLSECVMGGRWLDGYFEEQGMPVGNQECLEKFRRGCVDYISLQFVPKWDFLLRFLRFNKCSLFKEDDGTLLGSPNNIKGK